MLDVTLCKTDPVEDACDVCDSRLSATSPPWSKLPFASAKESDRAVLGASISFMGAATGLSPGGSCISSSDASVSELELRATWLIA